MSLLFSLTKFIADCLSQVVPGINTSKVVLEPTKDPSHSKTMTCLCHSFRKIALKN